MEYTLTRYEKILNEDSSVKEIFIATKLQLTDGIWEQGYWLTPIEVASVVADEANLTAISDRVAVLGEAAYNRYLAQPVVPTEPPAE